MKIAVIYDEKTKEKWQVNETVECESFEFDKDKKRLTLVLETFNGYTVKEVKNNVKEVIKEI